MGQNNELLKISKITEHIYLSGIFSMDDNPSLIKQNGIKYILSCTSKDHVTDVHNRILVEDPGVMILYLPYSDDIYQNLWKTNKNLAEIVAYTDNNNNYNKISSMMDLYKNKPLIEIGYHFIDMAVTNNERVLVHCMAGVSRSVSLVVYHLMKKNKMDFKKAYKHVRNIRSIANPNESFKSQLLGYGTKKDSFTEADADKIIITPKSLSDIFV